MSKEILAQIPLEFKQSYDFIPFANWDDSEKGSRPAPYKLKQRYEDNHQMWIKSQPDRVGIRLNNLVLIDYDGNKENAIGEIPSVDELATALGFTSSQSLCDTCLIQWNVEMTSLHFLFIAPPDFNTTDFKQSNQGTKSFFWKHIDIKTGNQLVYLKDAKTNNLRDPVTYPLTPESVIEELRSTSTFTANETGFDYNHKCSDHQVKLAEEWLHEIVIEMENTPDGNRNGTLNTLGCTVAGLVSGGALDNQAAYSQMYNAALQAGCEVSETVNTLASAWEEGFKTPRRDAPYVKSCKTISEVFESEVVHNTNITLNTDTELTNAVESGELDINDPNIGILHQQYTYFKENWVMNSEGKFIDKRNLVAYGKTAFNVLHNDMMPVKPGSKSFKKFVPSEIFEVAKPDVVSDLMYKPGGEKVFFYEGVQYLNSYIPVEFERPAESEISGMLALIYNHMKWLITDPSHQRFIVDWMAWQVQHLGELVGWVPLLMGCRGDGKSVLIDLVTCAIGSRNTKSVSNNSIISPFQDWAMGSAVAAFEEIKVDGREGYRVANDLKPFITEKRVTAIPKGKKGISIPNFCNYIAFSNDSAPLPIPHPDRRWFPLETTHFGKNTVIERTKTDMKDHFDAIKDATNHTKYHAAVHWALRDHVISDEFRACNYRAPETIFGRELSLQSVTEKEARLQEYLDNARFNDGRTGLMIEHVDGFQIQDFRPIMPENWFQGLDKKPSAIMLGKWLRNLGYEHALRLTTGGVQLKTYKQVL